MKRLVLIVEGETEENFVNNILRPYLCSKGIYNAVQCFKTKHSKGGISKYSYIKKDILNIIYEKDVIVSMMIDFYRLPSDFPGFSELLDSQTHQEKVSLLEAKIKEDIEKTKSKSFPILYHTFNFMNLKHWYSPPSKVLNLCLKEMNLIIKVLWMLFRNFPIPKILTTIQTPPLPCD